MRTVALLAALALAGCSGSRPPSPDSTVEPRPTPVTSDRLAGTVWMDTCDDFQYWVRFNEDGSVDYSDSSPDALQNDGTDTWQLTGSTLSLSWTDGYRVASFDVAGGMADRFTGTSEPDGCNGIVRLERVR